MFFFAPANFICIFVGVLCTFAGSKIGLWKLFDLSRVFLNFFDVKILLKFKKK